jgi:hypothetical protein
MIVGGALPAETDPATSPHQARATASALPIVRRAVHHR